jgi:hypothetical protein
MSVSRRLPAAGAAALALLAALSGCGRAASPLVVTPAPAAAVAPAQGAEASATAGRVESRLSQPGYRVQATVSQVKRLRVTLSGGPLPTPLVKEVTTDQLASGAGTVAFEGLPAGTVAVKVEALGADGGSLGSQSSNATITGGQTAVLAVALKLDATHVASANGNLAVDLTIRDGDVVVDPIASPSPRPTSPVLSPAPSPTPTPTPRVVLAGDLSKSYWADGTMSVAGSVRNDFGAAKAVTASISFDRRVLLVTVHETVSVELGTLAAGASKAFDVRSTKRFGENTAVSVSFATR